MSDVSANYNETVHARARELTGCALPSGERPGHSTRQNNQLQRNHLGLSTRQVYVPATLQRAEQRAGTRVQAAPDDNGHEPVPNAQDVPQDAPRRHVQVCHKATATLQHIVWDCLNFPDESTTGSLLPAFEEAKRSEDRDLQLQAVQRVIAVLTRQEPERPDDRKRGSGLAATTSSPGLKKNEMKKDGMK